MNDSIVELWLPYPPSTNRLWTRTRRGMRKSTEYEEWLLHAGLEARSQRAGSIKGPYKISITAARPDRRRRDLDNILKSISDLLKSIGAIEDDSLCELITARWVTSGDGVGIRLEGVGIE